MPITTAITPEDLERYSDEDLWDIYQSIKDGASSPAETFGFSDASLNSVERMALGYYRAKQFSMAAPIYRFLLQMAPGRASAWRGLGACAQSMKVFALAVECYKRAVKGNDGKSDPVAAVFMGEALCQLGDVDEGLKVLKEVIAAHDGQKTKDDQAAPYVMRAKAIVSANGGIPNPIVLRREGRALIEAASGAAAARGEQMFSQAQFNQIAQSVAGGDTAAGELVYDEDREIAWEDIQKNHKLMKTLGQLKEAVMEGRVTLAEVGGFTDDELDGAYACACKYAEIDQFTEAIQIAGYLIFIDPHKARYYQLVGIALQRMGQFDNADRYYSLASTLDGDDPMTTIYRGESKIMTGNIDDGLGHVRQGLEVAKTDPVAYQSLIDRANVLIRQFGR